MESLYSFLVDEASSGQRLDSYLAAQSDLPSRSALVKLIQAGNVTINGTRCVAKAEVVRLGDRVLVELASEVSEPAVSDLLAASIPLDIRFEDEELLVLSKQAGLVCHPSPGHECDTLANALVGRYGIQGLGTLQGEDRPGIVHRLDKDTTGLMVAAKTDGTQRALQDLIRLRELDRRYVTLVQGFVAPATGLIDVSIARAKRDRQKMCASDSPKAREAITTFTTLERFEAGPADDGYSLLECHLYTGRTHQIRVHMAHIHHPVVGDPLYGQGSVHKNLGLTRQFLHSWRLSFVHPLTQELLSFEDPLPADLAEVLKVLAPRSLGQSDVGQELVPRLLARQKTAYAQRFSFGEEG